MVTPKDCKCPSKRIPVHTGVTSTAGPIPNPLAGEGWWSHTRNTGSWQTWLWKSGLYPTDRPSGTMWRTFKASRQRPPWTQQKVEAGGRGPFKGHDGPGKSRSGHLTVMFHCTHIINTLVCFKTTAPATSKVVPASHPLPMKPSLG